MKTRFLNLGVLTISSRAHPRLVRRCALGLAFCSATPSGPDLLDVGKGPNFPGDFAGELQCTPRRGRGDFAVTDPRKMTWLQSATLGHLLNCGRRELRTIPSCQGVPDILPNRLRPRGFPGQISKVRPVRFHCRNSLRFWKCKRQSKSASSQSGRFKRSAAATPRTRAMRSTTSMPAA